MNPVFLEILILVSNIKYVNLYNNLSHINSIDDDDIDTSFRILGGHEVKKVYPYMVIVYFDKRYRCGGSIIAPKWVLTAAHCLYYTIIKDRVLSPFVVSTVAGIIHKDKTTHADHRISESIHVHKGYDKSPDDADYDIGLIEVRIPYHKNNVLQLVTFQQTEESLKTVTYCTIMGWGETVLDDSNALNELQVRLYSGNYCEHDQRQIRVLCVQSNFGSAYKGDSGGPLICNGLLYGVCSRGDVLDTTYTRVDYFLDWIHATINAAIENRSVQNLYSLILFIVITYYYFVAL